jgi:phage-related holin
MSKQTLMIGSISGIIAFICAFYLNLTIGSILQYFIIVSAVFTDGFFGMIAGVKSEGFETRKALKIIKSLTYYSIALTAMLSIELVTPEVHWLSELFIIPFITFQIISIGKNIARCGWIKNAKVLKLLSKIDQHKS